jgi:hypothetical protein
MKSHHSYQIIHNYLIDNVYYHIICLFSATQNFHGFTHICDLIPQSYKEVATSMCICIHYRTSCFWQAWPDPTTQYRNRYEHALLYTDLLAFEKCYYNQSKDLFSRDIIYFKTLIHLWTLSFCSSLENQNHKLSLWYTKMRKKPNNNRALKQPTIARAYTKNTRVTIVWKTGSNNAFQNMESNTKWRQAHRQYICNYIKKTNKTGHNISTNESIIILKMTMRK